MGTAVQHIHSDPNNTVEIVVHIDESLGEARRNELVNDLMMADGIEAAEFCPLRFHLMLVQYSRDLMSSIDVLGEVTSKNVHAKLIGPV